MIPRYQLWQMDKECVGWGIDYFRSPEDFEVFKMHREFIDDFADAERRAASLGKDHTYVQLVGILENGEDLFIASYGTRVNHRVRQLRNDPRGTHRCFCGAICASEEDMGIHLDVAEGAK